MAWFKLIIRGANGREPEEIACIAMDAGAAGCEISKDDTVNCFIECAQPPSEAFLDQFLAQEIEVISCSPVRDENWVANCEEVWTPVTAGAIKITPWLDGMPSNDEEGRVLISPGTGFGTGHHPSTQLAVRLLQHELLSSSPPKRALDLGTGSGVLAIACSVLYQPQIEGLDFDPLAIENAVYNLKLNNLPEETCCVGTIDDAGTDYDLILSNIYADTLVKLEPEFYERLTEKGALILAGIRMQDRGEITDRYAPDRWDKIEAQSLDNWWGALYRRKS